MRRFADYVAIIDGLLCAEDATFSDADALWVKDVATAPGCPVTAPADHPSSTGWAKRIGTNSRAWP